jgi:hypothetical protein
MRCCVQQGLRQLRASLVDPAFAPTHQAAAAHCRGKEGGACYRTHRARVCSSSSSGGSGAGGGSSWAQARPGPGAGALRLRSLEWGEGVEWALSSRRYAAYRGRKYAADGGGGGGGGGGGDGSGNSNSSSNNSSSNSSNNSSSNSSSNNSGGSSKAQKSEPMFAFAVHGCRRVGPTIEQEILFKLYELDTRLACGADVRVHMDANGRDFLVDVTNQWHQPGYEEGVGAEQVVQRAGEL